MATQVVSTESVGSGIPDATDASTTITQFANVDEESDLDEGEKKMLTMQFLERISDNSTDDQPEYPTLFDDDEESTENTDEYDVARAMDEEIRVQADGEQADSNVRDETNKKFLAKTDGNADIMEETNEEVHTIGDEEDPPAIETMEESPIEADKEQVGSMDAVEDKGEDTPSAIETTEESPIETDKDKADSIIQDTAEDEDAPFATETVEEAPVESEKDQADSIIQDTVEDEEEDAPVADESTEGTFEDIVLETDHDSDIADTTGEDDANNTTEASVIDTDASAIDASENVVATPGVVDTGIIEDDGGEDAIADDIKSHDVVPMDGSVSNEVIDEDAANDSPVADDPDSMDHKNDEDINSDDDDDEDFVDDGDLGQKMEKSEEENTLSLEEFVHSFVFTFDEEDENFSQTDGGTLDEGETYLEAETYLSDENDELKLIRDSYSEYKRVEETCIDPEASCYNNRKKGDFVDQACAAIDCFYWRLTSIFIKTRKTVKESAEKGKAVAIENINPEHIKEAKNAKEVFFKSFHEFTAMGYDTGASDGNTVGIKESFSTASDEEKALNEPRPKNSKNLFDKDCKQFSNFAGMTSKEANDFFESAHPSVMDFHDRFITPCMPDNASSKRPSKSLSQWLNGAESDANKTKVFDTPLILQEVAKQNSGSAPWDESSRPDEKEGKDITSQHLDQAEESKCDISEPEKSVCGSEERDTSTPSISSDQSSVPEEKHLGNSGGDGLDRGTDDADIELKKKKSGNLIRISFEASPSLQRENKGPTTPTSDIPECATVKAKKPKKQRFWKSGRSKKNESSRRVSSIILIKGDAIEATTPNEDFMNMIAANTKKKNRRAKRNSDNSMTASSFVLSAGGDTGCEVLF